MADARKDFEGKVIAQAQSDAGFRKRLLADPNATIRSMGYTLADSTEWNVLEETGGKLYLVLPRGSAQVGKGGALGDDALDQVVGGAMGGANPSFTGRCAGCGEG